MVRFIIRMIDGKYAVHKEFSGVASFCESKEAAIALARKLASEQGGREERSERLESGAIVIWRE